MARCFRSLCLESGNLVIDWCEITETDFEIWNAEDMVNGGAVNMEIGMSPDDWDRYDEAVLLVV